VEAPAEAHKITTRPNHSMARDYDWNGVLTISRAHSAHGSGAADFYGQLAVTARFAVWNGAQRVPDALLKLRAKHLEWQVKRAQLPREISAKLA